MLAIGIRNEFIVLNAVYIFIFGVKLIDNSGIFCGKGFESTWNDSYNKVLRRSNSFPQE